MEPGKIKCNSRVGHLADIGSCSLSGTVADTDK